MAAKKGGLGKGLDAIFMENATENSNSTVTLKISELEPNQDQPRREFDDEALAELADSIAQHGVLQPLLVRPIAGGGYQIVAGERRFRACRMAGVQEVPVVIRELSDGQVMELALIENLQREDLNPMEEAEGYLLLLTDYGMTQEEVAKRMGKSRPAIANALRLTALPPAVREMLVEGTLSAGHGRAVLMVEGESAQEAFAKEIIHQGLSVRQAEAAAKKFSLATPTPRREVKDAPNRIYVQAAEESLSGRLGRKVTITTGRKKGRLELEFYNMDDLNALLDLLNTLTPKRREGGTPNG